MKNIVEPKQKKLTNLQKKQRLNKSRRDARMRKIRMFRPLCVGHKFLDYACRKGWDKETTDAAAMMQHHFFMMHKDVEKRAWLGIPFETWETKFGSEYQRIRANLIDSGFLEEDKRRGYKKGSHCRHYRICQELRNDQITPSYRLLSDELQKRYLENKAKQKRMSAAVRQELAISKIRKACAVPDDNTKVKHSKKSLYELVQRGYITSEQLRTLERLATNAQLLRVKITDEELSKTSKERHAREKLTEDVDSYEERWHENLDQIYSATDEFNIDKYGRLYTPMTSMFRELWNYAYFKRQQLAGVDVKNSHPINILVLLKDIAVNYFGSTGSHEERLSKCQFARQIKMTPSLEGHLCRASDIFPAHPFFEFKKPIPGDLNERRKLMLELFKKFTNMHTKSIQKVYISFDTYIRLNFYFPSNHMNLADYLKPEKINADITTNYLLAYDQNTDHVDQNFMNLNLNNDLHDPNNNLQFPHVLQTSSTPVPLPCTSSNSSSNNHITTSCANAPNRAVGVGMQLELHQRVTNKLHAYRIKRKCGSISDPSTVNAQLFRNLFLPCPEEILEYERLLADDIYTLLMTSIGKDPETERDQFKKDFFHFLYRPAFSRFDGKRREQREDGTWVFKGIPEPVRQSMEELIPSILFFLDLCKCRPGTLKRKGKHYKKVSHLILRIESQIMLEACANLWKKYPKMFLTTVHDCIKCLPKDVKKVKAELERTFKKYHVSPKFEVKEHKRPSDVNG